MALTNDRVKANLCKELKLALKNAAVEIPFGDYISSEVTLTLCNVIEAIFIHGLKDPFFLKGSRYARYPEPNFWPFLFKYTHKSIKLQIDSLNQIKTEIGKARAWIRIVLNENSMEHYLRLFARDPQGFSAYYHRHAFLRDFENYNLMTGYMKVIAKITVDAPVNSSFLNSWTPTPLILAGLVAGKPVRLEKLSSQSRRNSFSEEAEFEEVGECALDLIELETASELASPYTAISKISCADEDELSSVYSHPSMIENGVGRPPTFFFSSTPERSDILSEVVPESSSFTTEAYQVNVRRRKHRLRRVSKSSSEEGLQSRSESANNLHNIAKQKACVAKEDTTFNSNPVPREASVGVSTPHLSTLTRKDSSTVKTASTTSTSVAADVSGKSAQLDKTEEDVRSGTALENCSSELIQSNDACFCEDSCDSGVAEVSLSHLDYRVPETSPKYNFHGENEEMNHVKGGTEFGCDKKPGSSSPNPQQGNRNDSILSLQEELLLTESGNGGNSLVGKGWAFCSPQSIQQDWEQTSGHSSSLRTNSSHNFDSMIRNVVTGYESNEMETSVRSRLDSENFSETFNDEASSGIEVGTTSIRDHADEGSFIATATFLSSTNKNMQKQNIEQNDGVTEEEDLNGEDVYGISRDLIPLLTKIPHETGLAEQNFRCSTCSRSIGPTFSPYRACGFDGKYYCTNCCRKSDQSIIPSRLIHSWDFRPRPVCRKNLAFLRAVEDRPIIRLDKVNPTIYDHCGVMKKILGLREKLALAAMYLLSCRQSVAEDLRLRLWPKEYLYNDVHLYSFSDFQCALSGQLEGHLNSIIRYAINHIFHCKLCVQKGFFCEICSSREVIYPFQVETTVRCTACFSVYHKRCFESDRCRKCARRERYAEKGSSLGDHLVLD